MKIITKILFALAGLGFVLAVVVVLFTGKIMGVSAESFSRACTNLAVLDILLLLLMKNKDKG